MMITHEGYTIEQKLEAAQCLWYAVNVMYSNGDKKAVEWFNLKGVSGVRYACRGAFLLNTFWQAREFVDAIDKSLWIGLEEEFAPVFLRTCVTSKSMNSNRDWKVYLRRAVEEELLRRIEANE